MGYIGVKPHLLITNYSLTSWDVQVYQLESRWLSTPMYFLCHGRFQIATFGSCAIYFHHSVFVNIVRFPFLDAGKIPKLAKKRVDVVNSLSFSKWSTWTSRDKVLPWA